MPHYSVSSADDDDDDDFQWWKYILFGMARLINCVGGIQKIEDVIVEIARSVVGKQWYGPEFFLTASLPLTFSHQAERWVFLEFSELSNRGVIPQYVAQFPYHQSAGYATWKAFELFPYVLCASRWKSWQFWKHSHLIGRKDKQFLPIQELWAWNI